MAGIADDTSRTDRTGTTGGTGGTGTTGGAGGTGATGGASAADGTAVLLERAVHLAQLGRIDAAFPLIQQALASEPNSS